MRRSLPFGLMLAFLLVMLWLADSPPTASAGRGDVLTPVSAESAAPVPLAAQIGAVTLTSTQRQQLAEGTVQVVMLKDTPDGLVIIGAGSGTLISPDGLVLTNAHVASPATMGDPANEPDMLGIAVLARDDEPPIPTFFASIVAVDGFLDLAVLRIDSNLDGSPIRPNDISLPHVTVGDSDDLRLGDNLYIFGFPGIGGDTITFTRGSVAGFSSQDPIGNRAWIKTDATIAGGNSGGLAVADNGVIIGVPTRASSGADGQIADCRVVQDTNNDGKLDDRDTCIPIGGFINALRPVNLAKPLVRAAQSGNGYSSPFPTIGGLATSSRQQMALETWSESADSDGCAINPTPSFPSGATRITAVLSYSGMSNGETVGYAWLIDDEVVLEDTFEWGAGSSGDCFPFWLENGGNPLPDGEYVLLVGAGDGLPIIAQAETRVGGAPVRDTIQMAGSVVSAATGKPISGALVVVLTPGVLVSDWLDNPAIESVFTFTETDASGNYILPDRLQRGVRYDAVVLADGYLNETGFLEFSAEDPAEVLIDVALSR